MKEKLVAYGSICLSKIPKELITKGKDDNDYIHISIFETEYIDRFGYTHFISTRPRKKDIIMGKDYKIGKLTTFNPKKDKIE